MTLFKFLREKLGESLRCDFYFENGRVEVHSIENSSTIFVRIAKKVIHEKDFVAIDFIPEAEYMINGAETIDTELSNIRNLIEDSQKRISYPD